MVDFWFNGQWMCPLQDLCRNWWVMPRLCFWWKTMHWWRHKYNYYTCLFLDNYPCLFHNNKASKRWVRTKENHQLKHNKSSRGGLEVEQWSDNRNLSISVDRSSLGAHDYMVPMDPLWYRRLFCNNTKVLQIKRHNFVNVSHLLIWRKLQLGLTR